MTNNIISVWGSPSSGKTTISIKLASELASKKKNIAIVFADNTYSTLSSVYAECKEHNKSIGKILTTDYIEKETILENSVLYKKNENILLIGLSNFENNYTYSKYTTDKVVQFFSMLHTLVDYIIVDCSSIINLNPITIFSLEKSRSVIRVIEPSLKSMSYFNSTIPLLIANEFKSENHINVISNFKPKDNKKVVSEKFDIQYEFPYMEEVREQSANSELFEKLTSRDRYIYNKSIRGLIEDAFDEDFYTNNETKVKGNRFWKKQGAV